MNPSALEPSALVDLVFPEADRVTLAVGDSCTLDGDPRPHRIAEIQGDMAVVHLVAFPSATLRRVRLDECFARSAE